jgi:2-iminobutanoate/2-iminopropanoate deaminase
MVDKIPLVSPQAPRAIGPYSSALRAGTWIFVSGLIGLDPANGELVSPDFKPQAERALRNLEALCEEAGGMDRVVKVTVFLTDLGDYQALNELFVRFWQAPYPARSVVQVVALPRGARIEVEAIVAGG